MPAPIVLGHSWGEQARKMVELAEKLGIPVREDENLSDILIKVEPKGEIPEDLYSIIAVIYTWLHETKRIDLFRDSGRD